MTKQILGIIPARYASTRLPGKLLIPILGQSVLQRTFENAKKITSLNQLIVATDDVRIFEHVQAWGGEVVMTSTNCLTGTDRLAEVLTTHPEWLKADAIVNIQGDEPCVDAQAVNQAIDLLLNDPTAQMATLVTPLTNPEEALSASVVKCVMDQHSNALYFSRALVPSNKKQTFQTQTTYYRHIGLYVYRPAFLMTYQSLPATPLQLEEDLEQLKVLEHGYRIKVAITSTLSIGVDVPEDIQKLEEWICQQNTSL
jgi:3-deoxy-manno-octulosonate cytidylyltransferase (CMP-KDO synthetase)